MIRYAEIGDLTLTPWLLDETGNYTACGVGIVAHGNAVSLDLNISRDGKWKVQEEDECFSGAAASAETARPAAEDIASLIVRLRAAERRADAAEQEVFTLLREGVEKPEKPAASPAAAPEFPAPARGPAHAKGPAGPAGPPAWPLERLRPLADRLRCARSLVGSWAKLAEQAKASGFKIDESSLRQWSRAKHAPIKRDNAARVDAFLASLGLEEEDELAKIILS